MKAVTFEKLYPTKNYAVQRVERGARQTVSLMRTEAEARDMARRQNRVCGTRGPRGVRYEAVRIKRADRDR